MPSQKKIPHPHESWCLRVALRFCGRPIIHERFRQNRVVDAIMYMPEPVDLWGPLAAHLSQREVLIEHFSNSVSEADFFSCVEKLAYASHRYSRVPLKDRGERQHPTGVILSHRRPDRLIREFGLFEAMDCPGMWLRRPLDFGAMFLIATSHLTEDPAFDWLRLSTRVPQTKQELLKVESLLNHRKIDKLVREEMEDHMFQLVIDGKTPKEIMAENAQLEADKIAAEKLLLLERVAAEQQLLMERAAFQAEIEELKKQLEELKKR